MHTRATRKISASVQSQSRMIGPVRIAHVSDYSLPRLGGIEVHVDGLVRHQREAGHTVDVVTALDGNGGPFARLRPSVIHEVADTIRAGRYDVVHVHAGVYTPIAFGAAAAASRAGIPTVVTAHSLVNTAHVGLRALDLATGWTRLPVAWTAVSQTAAGPLQRLLGPDVPVHVLPNAVDAAEWRVTPVPRDRDHVVIVAVNRLAMRKRPLPLLRSLRRARSEVDDSVRMSAVIVGDGPQRATLERAVARGGMADWVHVPGRLPHDAIRGLYGRADVFVAPARLESFGIAALEARAAGLPIIAMAHSGISTFVTHGRDGLLVDDDRGLAEAIATVATDETVRARIATHNRSCPPAFGWPEALDRTEREYERAAAVHDIPRLRRPARSRRVAAEVSA